MLNVGAPVGAAILGGVIGNIISYYVCQSYKKNAEHKTTGLRILTEVAGSDFNNQSHDPRNPDFELGEEGSWTEERTNGFVFGLRLSQDDSRQLIRKVEDYRENLGTNKRTATKKTLIDTCNGHRDRIQAETKRNSTLAKYGLPILGAVCGFIYGWFNR